MALLDQVRSLLCEDGTTMYECRVCGTNAASEVDRCAECGSTEIVAFEI